MMTNIKYQSPFEEREILKEENLKLKDHVSDLEVTLTECLKVIETCAYKYQITEAKEIIKLMAVETH